MKMRAVIKIFYIFLLFNILLFSQESENRFEENANKIIVMVSKEIYLEKYFKDKTIKEKNSFDDLKKYFENKKLTENIKLLDSLISLKNNKHLFGNNLFDSLYYFWQVAKKIIPNQKNPDRLFTIEKLDFMINNSLDSLNKKNPITTIKKESETPSYLDKLLFSTLIGLNLFIVVLIVFLFYKVHNIRRISKQGKYLDLDKIYSKIDNIEKNINFRFNNFILPQKEYEKIKSQISNEIFSKIRESNILSNNSFSEVAEEINDIEKEDITKFPVVKFIESPERDGYFETQQLKDNRTQRALYKVIFFDEKIEFDLLSDNYEFHRYAMNNMETMLKPACEFDEIPTPNQSKILKVSNENGLIKKEGNKLVIIKKLKIKFV